MSAQALTTHPPPPLPPAWTLVLPSVTIGNTPQLSVDLLLTTLPATHLSHLRAPSILPFASPAPRLPSHRTTLVTALELYRLNDSDVFLLQQRAPTVAGRAQEFATEVVEWAVANGCRDVVIVCSSNAAGLRGLNAAVRPDDSGEVPSWARAFRYLASTEGLKAPFVAALQRIGVPVMETATGDMRGWERDGMDNVRRDLRREEARVPAFVPSAREGSFVRGVLEQCEKRGVAVGGVVQFVHEGDNAADAKLLASVVGLAVGVVEGGVEEGGARWVVPKAWGDAAGVPLGLY